MQKTTRRLHRFLAAFVFVAMIITVAIWALDMVSKRGVNDNFSFPVPPQPVGPRSRTSAPHPARMKQNIYRQYAKRLFDVIVSFVGLVMLSPVMLTVAVLVYLKLGSPVIFRQERPGLNGKPFYMYKFRSMSNACDAKGNLLPDEKRLTRFGQWLRSSSLDELPELFNVLKGDMSLIGPRPLKMEYLPRYSSKQARRHEMLPGITGWAQINGRNAISWEERFELDVWYIDNCSALLDFKIILRTMLKVIQRDGISQEGHVTMSSFMGCPKLIENSRQVVGLD